MPCGNAAQKTDSGSQLKNRQKTCVKVPKKKIAFVNVTKDKRQKLTNQKLNYNNTSKRQIACVIPVKRQMASLILSEESTDNSLPASLFFKNTKDSSLCSTYE